MKNQNVESKIKIQQSRIQDQESRHKNEIWIMHNQETKKTRIKPQKSKTQKSKVKNPKSRMNNQDSTMSNKKWRITNRESKIKVNKTKRNETHIITNLKQKSGINNQEAKVKNRQRCIKVCFLCWQSWLNYTFCIFFIQLSCDRNIRWYGCVRIFAQFQPALRVMTAAHAQPLQ